MTSSICLHGQSYLILCDPMDYSPPGSSVHGILQERVMQWVAIPFSRGSPQPRDGTWVSCIAGRFFTAEPLGKPKINESHSVLPYSCDPMDYRLHGILQTRMLEWLAVPFPKDVPFLKGSSQHRDQTQVSNIVGRFFTS